MNQAEEGILRSLQEGKVVVQGEFLWGSNYTFLVEIQFDSQAHQAVYKPARGERPLWDFPTASLGRREVAAYLLSSVLGWDLVPPTVYRKKGPLGGGSLQWFIEHNPNYHYFNFTEEDRQRLRPTVLFDILINNADRKGSHILKDPNDHLWLIDHGVCFHVEDKLRTVIWDFMGEPIPADLRHDIRQMRRKLAEISSGSNGILAQIQEYISPVELRALAKRADNLIASSCFPEPDPSRRPFPWPQI
jgi:uncharacterized repeat protein (TIGR03843 family)